MEGGFPRWYFANVNAVRHPDETPMIDKRQIVQTVARPPHKWDPMFRDFMTFSDVFRYPAIPLEHHLNQVIP